MVPKPRAVFFDLDQTLLENTGSFVEQLRSAWPCIGEQLPPDAVNRFEVILNARGTQLWLAIADHRGAGQQMLEQFMEATLIEVGAPAGGGARLLEALVAATSAAARSRDDAHALLDTLSARGYRTGVITNGFTIFQRRKAMDHGILERVSTFVTSEDAGAHKPDPRIFAYARSRIQVDAADCWHVGDSLSKDIQGAHQSGVTSVLYIHEPGEPNEIQREPRPHFTVRRLRDLLELL